MRQLCQVLHVAPAVYYAWQRHQQRLPVELAWQVAVRGAFANYSQRYGTYRLRAQVQAQGYAVGRWRIRRALKAHGLRAQQPPSFAAARTTDSDPAVRAALNRLLGRSAPIAPNRVWEAGTPRTCRTKAAAGCTWPCGWTAAHAKSSAGMCARPCPKTWSVKHSAALWPCAVRRPPGSSLVHSDQGSQYTATRFKDLVAKHGAQQSLSRRSNSYDNAHAESFWSHFKAELFDGGNFPGLTEARLKISHHIAYYNAERWYSALGYQALNHFEKHLQTTSQLYPA